MLRKVALALLCGGLVLGCAPAALAVDGKISARGVVMSTPFGDQPAPTAISFSAANDCNAGQSSGPSIVEWAGVRFTKTAVEYSSCEDDPSLLQIPPTLSGFDTQYGVAFGTLSGARRGPGRLYWGYYDGGANERDTVTMTVVNQFFDPLVFMNQAQVPQPLGGSPGGVWTFRPDVTLPEI